MGIFSTKKTITVSSTLYNLAGSEEGRPDFLKSSIFSTVIDDNPKNYVGQSLVTNILNGPGIDQRNFFNWAVRNDFSGLPTYTVKRSEEVDTDIIKNLIPDSTEEPTAETEVHSAILTDADFVYWAEQYILDNNPELYNTNWVSDYDNIAHEITIQYEDLSTVTFDAGTFDPNKQYVIAHYFQQIPIVTEDFVLTNDQVNVYTIPDTSDYTVTNQVVGFTQSFNLNVQTTVVKEYSGSTPTTTTVTNESSPDTFDTINTVKEKLVYIGSENGNTIETRAINYKYTEAEKRAKDVVTSTTVEENEVDGETETTTTTTDTQVLVPIWNYKEYEQDITYSTVLNGDKIFIYEIGSGNSDLDSLVTKIENNSYEFYPFIPVRLNNDSITDPKYINSGYYEENRKAYRKAFSKNGFSELIDNVEDNDSLSDIDYAYLTFGVPLNVVENASRKYVYLFYKYLSTYFANQSTDIASFNQRVIDYKAAVTTYREWISAQDEAGGNPTFGFDVPPRPVLVLPDLNTITIKTNNTAEDNYDTRISWYSIEETSHIGLGKIEAKKGDIWFESEPKLQWQYPKSVDFLIDSEDGLTSSTETLTMDSIVFYNQVDESNYTKLKVYGSLHENYIYKGKFVSITGSQALEDEDESGFLVPLHYPTLRTMSLVEATQMTTANAYIVFNSYQVTKQKWYQSTVFSILVVILIVVISVFTFGTGGILAGGGLLGANAAVGASLGLTGTAALIAGAAANAIAGIALAQVLKYGATELLGKEIGSIVAAVTSFIITAGIGSGGIGSFDFAALTSPQNILKLSGVLANGYKDFVETNIAELTLDVQDLQKQLEEQSEFITNMLLNLGGINNLSFNPLELIEVNAGNDSNESNFLPESLDEFIHRTTMVGSDVVDISLSMVNNYSDLSLTLPKN